MALWVKKKTTGTDAWASVNNVWVKKKSTGTDAWVPAKKIWVKKSESFWALFWPQSGAYPEEDLYVTVYPTYYPSDGSAVPELTVYNQHWVGNGSVTLSYKWQVGNTSVGPWEDITSFVTYNPGNPSSGNTNSISFTPDLFDYSSGKTYFNFVMRAIDSNSTSYFSAVSDPVFVGPPTWQTEPQWEGSGGVNSTLSWNVGSAWFDTSSDNVGYMTTIYKTNNGGITKVYLAGSAVEPDFSFSDLYKYDFDLSSADAGYTYYASTYAVFSDGYGQKVDAEASETISDYKAVISNYSFSIGDSLYVSTNGYVGLTSGSSSYSAVPTSGSNIVVQLSDFVQYQTAGGSGDGLLLYWSNSSQYSIRWSGYLYGHENNGNYRLTYQINFYDNGSYYDIKYIHVGSSVYSTARSAVVPGLYTDGTLIAAGTTQSYPWLIGTGTTYRVYYDGSSIQSGISFTEIDTVRMISAGTVTAGSTDDGWTELTTAANQSVPDLTAPTISFVTTGTAGGPVSVSFTGGSGPAYQMYWWSSSSAPSGIVTPDASGTSSPLTDSTGPVGGSNQYMYVRSVATIGETSVGPSTVASAWSSGVLFNMTVPNATAPTSVSATAGNAQATVTWSGSTNATKYRVWWSTSSTGNNVDPATNYKVETTSPATLTGLTNGTLYYFWVSASNTNSVWTPYSSSPRGSTTPVAPNVAPTGGSAYISGTTTQGQVLTANVTNAAGNPTPTYTYQWQNDSFGTSGGVYGNLTGYTSSTYTLGPYDAGQNVRVVVTFSNGISPNQVYTTASVGPITAIYWRVSYDVNGGSSATPSYTDIKQGTSGNVTSSTATRTGYTFGGWNTASDGSGTNYAVNALITPTADITLYAKWTVANVAPHDGSVSVSPNPGTAPSTTFTATPSGWLGIPSTFTYSYQWQYLNNSFSWITVGSNSSTYTAPVISPTPYQWRVNLTVSNGVSPDGTASGSFTVNNPAAATFTIGTVSASRTAAKQITGTWTSTRSGGTFYWWNTRIRNTATQGTTAHTLFSETPKSDVFTNLSGTSYRFGVQGVAYDSNYSTQIYTVGSSDTGAYTENSTNINPT